MSLLVGPQMTGLVSEKELEHLKDKKPEDLSDLKDQIRLGTKRPNRPKSLNDKDQFKVF